MKEGNRYTQKKKKDLRRNWGRELCGGMGKLVCRGVIVWGNKGLHCNKER